MGAVSETDPLSLRGCRLGPLRVGEYLGAGSMACVYRAELVVRTAYAPRGTAVAVKLLHADLAALAPSLLCRFRREAAVGRAIDDPAVVRTFASGSAMAGGRERHYLVLELVEGQSLRHLLDELGVLPEPLLRSLGAQLAAGLAAVHRAGAVHRDVKPENIWITRDERVKLMDLGVSHLVAARGRLTSYGQFVGSALYAAPEQLDGRAPTPATDLYALGLVLHEAASGAHPFAGGSFEAILRRRASGTPERLRTLGSGLSPLLDELVARLLEECPETRLSSADDVAEVLRQGEMSPWWRRRCRSLAPGERHPPPFVPVGRRARLHGRERELETLASAYRRAAAGDGNGLLLEGEAGIGKSRLAAELVEHATRTGGETLVLYGSCARGPGQASLGALTRPLVACFGTAGLDRRLARLLAPQRRLAATLASLLRRSAAGAIAAELPASALRAIVDALSSALSRERTLLWIVEDLHLAGDDDRAVVSALAAAAAGRRMLVVVTARPDGAAPAAPAVLARVPVGPLGGAAVAALLAELLGTQGDGDLAGRLALRSDGNPYVLLELAQPDQAVAHGRSSAPALPETLSGLVAGRLQRLPREQQSLLDVAAVQGFQFDPDLVARATGRPPLDVLRTLAYLERRAGLVRAAGDRFQFERHVVQEAIYAGIEDVRRREIHGLLAEQRDSRAAKGEAALFLAEHFLRAGRGDDGARHLPAALALLGSRWQDHAQLELCALALESRAGGDALRVDVRLAQIDCLRRLGRRGELDEPIADLVRAARRARDRRRLARALHAQAIHLLALGDDRGARRLARLALAEARAARDRPAEVLAGLALATAELRRSRFAAARAGFQAARHAAGSRLPRLARLAALDLAQLEISLTRYRAAQPLIERWLQSFASNPDPFLEATTWGNLGVIFLYIGQPRRARRLLDRGLAITRELGLKASELVLAGHLGCVHGHLGDLAFARRSFEQQVVLAAATSNRERESQGHCNLAMLAVAEGRLADARDHLDRASEAIAGAARPLLTAFACQTGSDLAFVLGDLDRARTLAAHALVLLGKEEAGPWGARILVSLGRAELAAGDRAAARVAFRAAAALARRGEVVCDPRPAAYLALLDGSPAAAVEIPARAPSLFRAEAHQALARAGANGHDRRARALLETLSRHLDGHDRDRFRHQGLLAHTGHLGAGGAPRLGRDLILR